MTVSLPIFIVIVNWQRANDTIECVRSIYASGFPETRVLVVDNGSQDGSVQRISQTLPDVSVLSLPENLGFAGGYNAGIHHVLEQGAQNILLLNNDTVIEENTIRELARAPWDVSVPKILFQSTRRIWAAGAGWRRFPPSVVMFGYGLWGRGEPDGPRWNRPYPLAYATGCALMVKRHVFDVVGGFDRIYESYMEDYDFCYRVRQAGFTIGYVPDARVLHKVSSTLGMISPQWWRYLGRNTVLFYRREGRFPAWMLWSLLAWILPRELIKGNASHLPHFWRGVREGFDLMEQAKWDQYDTCGL